MALEFLHNPNNKVSHVSGSLYWSDDDGATWVRLSTSAECEITPNVAEDEVITNSGAGVMSDVYTSYTVSVNFIERGEDVRLMWSDDEDQGIAGIEGSLWIEGAKVYDSSGDDTYEQWCFPNAKLKRDHGTYALGTGSAIFNGSFYCRANLTCADVTIAPPSGDDCYHGAAADAATIAPGQFKDTFDSIGS